MEGRTEAEPPLNTTILGRGVGVGERVEAMVGSGGVVFTWYNDFTVRVEMCESFMRWEEDSWHRAPNPMALYVQWSTFKRFPFRIKNSMRSQMSAAGYVGSFLPLHCLSRPGLADHLEKIHPYIGYSPTTPNDQVLKCHPNMRPHLACEMCWLLASSKSWRPRLSNVYCDGPPIQAPSGVMNR